MRSWVFGAGVAAGAFWAGLSAQAQMDDVTMPGGEKKAPPAVLKESEFKEWAAKPGAVVFDLQYKGLTDKEINQANSFWGYGSQSPKTAFIKSVGLAKDKGIQFHLPLLRGSDEGFLEYEGKTAKAVYLDLDGDGKLGKGEKLEPVGKPKDENEGWNFVSPDFTATLADGKKVPFRVMVRVNFYDERPQVMCAPFCFWEGKAKLGDAETTLRLTDGGFDGSFVDFGRDSVALVKKTDDPNQNQMPQSTLSSLTCQDKVFYQLRFTGEGTKEKPLRAVLCKDNTPTGKVEVKMVEIAAEPKLRSARLVSTETPSILFDINGADMAIPQGRYRMERGSLSFGKNDTGMVSFSNGPECRIEAGKTATVELGQPKLKVVAIEESKRDSTMSDNKGEARTSFPAGTDLYLDLKLTGKQGEEYGSIYGRSEKGEYLPPAKPHLTILGPDGKEVASSDLEFG
ncbi:MAG TPA: hypothetical protein PLA90_18240 [Candidatus Sumerlaeota bacterium]|nr:hypothetical protein [Candidatus Sumerlaeota bacterium]